jgi:hypothetical protein
MRRHSKFVTLTACAGPTIAAVAFAAGPAAAQGMPTVDMVIGNNFGHLPMFVGVENRRPASPGRADPACRSECRSHTGDASSGRTAPPIFQSVSFRQGQGFWLSKDTHVARCPHRQDNRPPQLASD